MNIICTSKTIDKHIMENTKIFLMGGNSEFKSLRLFPFTMASLWNEPKYNKTYKITNPLKAIDPKFSKKKKKKKEGLF